jgi:hypothetical protein
VFRFGSAAAILLASAIARADAPASPESPSKVDLEHPVDTKEVDALAEAPPPEPHRKGVVLDANAGALFFVGGMGKVATPAMHFRVILGYELLKWLMLFGRGELGFSTTGNLEEPPFRRAFPLVGFGAGVRATLHFTDRVAGFLEGSLGALTCNTPTNALRNLGLTDAEKLRPDALGRIGIEWYQLDRHFALGVAGGIRLATGFARSGQRADTPLLAETQLTLRYTF